MTFLLSHWLIWHVAALLLAHVPRLSFFSDELASWLPSYRFLGHMPTLSLAGRSRGYLHTGHRLHGAGNLFLTCIFSFSLASLPRASPTIGQGIAFLHSDWLAGHVPSLWFV